MHVPVLLEEVLDGLEPAPGEGFVDGTAGAGGHAKAIVERIGDSGLLMAFDWDVSAFDIARDTLAGHANVLFFRENYVQIPSRVRSLDLEGRISGVLLDLGLSSMQLADPRRGFSFNGGSSTCVWMTACRRTPPLSLDG